MQNATGLSAEIVKRNDSGMSLATLEDMLSDLRYQPPWREEADVCDDYYDAHQLKTDRLQKMEALGIPPLVTNLIAPVINSQLGMEAKSRTDWRVTEEDEADEVPEDVLLALNARLNKVERESRADRAISDAYAAQLKSGVGWAEVSRNSDVMAYPYRVVDVDRNEMWWDWRAKQPDLSDARYLIRKRRFDQDVLTAMMPEHAELIKWAVTDRFKTWQWETLAQLNNSTDLAYAAHLERVTNLDENEWRDAERKRATVFEVWYRQWKRGPVLYLPNGRIVPFDRQNPRHVAAVRQGMIIPQHKVFSSLRVAFFLGCHRLYDQPTPYKHQHFPYVPFFGYRESRTGIRYGMIRNMISPQNVVNSADAKMHWLLNAKRIIADSDAIDMQYNTWKQVQEQVASPNAVVLLDPNKPNARFKVETDFQLSAQQFSRRQQAAADIEAAAGVYKAALGKEGAATSGVGIDSLIEQSNIMMAEINDNYSFSRRQVGELVFSLVFEDMIGKEMKIAFKEKGKKRIVHLNRKAVNEQGQEVVENDISAIRTKVALSDVPSTASFKSQQLRIVSEVAKSLPPQMQALLVPAMVMLTDMPDKEDTAEAIRKLAGITPKMTDEEQAAADEAKAKAQEVISELERRTAEANVKLLENKVAQLEQQNRKIGAERLVKMVEALYSAMQAGQIVATVPQVAPIADELLKGAGYDDQDGGDLPQIDNGMQAQSGDVQAVSALPQPESPVEGAQAGIETMENDGVLNSSSGPDVQDLQ